MTQFSSTILPILLFLFSCRQRDPRPGVTAAEPGGKRDPRLAVTDAAAIMAAQPQRGPQPQAAKSGPCSSGQCQWCSAPWCDCFCHSEGCRPLSESVTDGCNVIDPKLLNALIDLEIKAASGDSNDPAALPALIERALCVLDIEPQGRPTLEEDGEDDQPDSNETAAAIGRRVDRVLTALDNLHRPLPLAEQRAGAIPSWFPLVEDGDQRLASSSPLREQCAGAAAFVLGDEGGSDSGWLVIRPRYDDGGGSQPQAALLPSFPPHQPRAGGAPVVLVAQQQTQQRGVAL